MKPESTKERISSLDILRGFALLGIVVVNSLGFNASFFNFGGYYGSLPDPEQQLFYNVFISLTADKFIFLFSFLFGYGIFMQYRKFKENNQPFGHFFSRRMMLLAMFGMAHVVLLWAGDILLPYAIAGLIVFLLRKAPTVLQLMLAIFFYFFVAFWMAASTCIPLPDSMTSLCTECLGQARIVYSSGNYFEILQLRLHEYADFRNINMFYYLPKIIGITLFGFVASKYFLHKKVAAHKLLWAISLVLIAVVAIIIYLKYESVFSIEGPFAMAAFMAGYELMNLFVASTYLLFILLIASFPAPARLLKPFALMGRMSLTNYLMQSLILGIIFYGWGFGFFGQTNVMMVVGIALAVYVFQIIVNIVWFRFYDSGPLEKVWRTWSYRKLL
ncbi:MAG: hypothetical protein A2W93_03805 [Bacteroidetes bacterium GWF2_43_63]|nr:MAG: hypothetical protein A2W94_15895 [Bacteroidetes bacterium GWE2_42_42]OFY55351.1 MAG: hypothetical protein A2W93_03805 [Bacteroidetes bacterium GWF2_43_63]HBG71880.1 hypothetical protein [Bacteroidales bacterium]HCB61778.1 hypothetical protein [Bacteroidales bacterium]HCY22626.1 hypothetical protein [Bacteroidales bacterium]